MKKENSLKTPENPQKSPTEASNRYLHWLEEEAMLGMCSVTSTATVIAAAISYTQGNIEAAILSGAGAVVSGFAAVATGLSMYHDRKVMEDRVARQEKTIKELSDKKIE